MAAAHWKPAACCLVCSEGGCASIGGICLFVLVAEQSGWRPEVSSQGAGSDITS